MFLGAYVIKRDIKELSGLMVISYFLMGMCVTQNYTINILACHYTQSISKIVSVWVPTSIALRPNQHLPLLRFGYQSQHSPNLCLITSSWSSVMPITFFFHCSAPTPGLGNVYDMLLLQCILSWLLASPPNQSKPENRPFFSFPQHPIHPQHYFLNASLIHQISPILRIFLKYLSSFERLLIGK